MVKYRKRKYAGRGRRRMRRVRRRIGRKRFKRARRSRKTYYFKRTVTVPVTAAAGSQTFAGYGFQLNYVPNYTEFTSLFDMYRINKVVYKFVSRTTSSALSANECGELYSVVDYDDISAPLTVAEMLERDTVKRSKITNTHTRILTPAVAAVAYRTGITNAYMPKWKQWIDAAYVDVPHFGLKVCYDNRDNVDSIFDVYITYYMSFRNVR